MNLSRMPRCCRIGSAISVKYWLRNRTTPSGVRCSQICVKPTRSEKNTVITLLSPPGEASWFSSSPLTMRGSTYWLKVLLILSFSLNPTTI
jgi:hypothetical protein